MIILDDKNWIKLSSRMIDWEWYRDQNTKALFIHCLLKANWKDGKFEGHDIPRGSFVTGRKKLAQELGLSEQEIRTALKHLISTNELTIKKTNKFSIISIVNYEMYQQANQQLTSNQPATNQQLTTIEEEKESIYEERNSIFEEIYRTKNIEENTSIDSDLEKEEIYKEEKAKIFDYDWMDDQHEEEI